MKNQKLLIILVPVLCCLLAAVAYIKMVNTETDAIKFKNEYEELNGVEVYGEKYSDLNKEEIKFIKKKLNITKIQDIDTAILKELKEALKQLKDTRNKNMITL